MCGILGKITWATDNTPLPPLSALQHRGPDGMGEWHSGDGKVYLGHTRLAILDPTPAGRQPMSDASGRFTITFNGEIYNHKSLRQLLPNIYWRSGSDTETLLELLAAIGLEPLPLLKGMFAFGLHDAADGSVLLVRDRLGIKPLWLRHTESSLSFASEIRAIRQPSDAIPTKEALSEYIAFGRMPGQGEVFTGLQAIPPGGWVKVLGNGILKKTIWWPGPKLRHRKVQGRKRVAAWIKSLVETSVQEHLISDVGVGSFLSGGIDSSIITLLAGRELGKSLHTFSVGFPQTAIDERKLARQVAAKAGSTHFELEVAEQDCLKWVVEVVGCMDLPSVDAINTYIVSKAVRQTGLKVALSGLGGDELFGGYPGFQQIPFLSWLQLLPKSMSRRIAALLPQSVQDKLNGLPDFSTISLTLARRRFVPVEQLNGMGFNSGTPVIGKVPPGLDTMGLISWAEMQGYMIPMLLRDSDQMSMASGLEVRVPFLDHCLVEEVLSLPQWYKWGWGVKPLLVKAFEDVLPTAVYNRPKQGFELPMKDWIKGPLQGFVQEGLSVVSGVLQISEPWMHKAQFYNNKLHWTRLWGWAVLGHWLKKQHLKGEQEFVNSYSKDVVANLT